MHVDEELGPLEVSRSDTHVVLLPRVVELSQTPIDQTKLAVGVVDHDIVRLDITVHNALRVAEVERLQNLEHVEADVEVVEALVELAEVSVTRVDELSDNGRRLGQWVSHNINKVDNVRSALERLQYLDLAPNLVLLHYNSRIEWCGVSVISTHFSNICVKRTTYLA